MILAAAKAVAGAADVSAPGAALLPSSAELRTASSVVALQVAQAAQEQDVATIKLEDPCRGGAAVPVVAGVLPGSGGIANPEGR